MWVEVFDASDYEFDGELGRNDKDRPRVKMDFLQSMGY